MLSVYLLKNSELATDLVMKSCIYFFGIFLLLGAFVESSWSQFSVTFGSHYTFGKACYSVYEPVYCRPRHVIGWCGHYPVKTVVIHRPAFVYDYAGVVYPHPVCRSSVRNTVFYSNAAFYPSHRRGFRDPMPYCSDSEGGVRVLRPHRVVIFR